MQLLDAAKSFLCGKIKEDDTLVDFTMGNGHDTAYLCSLVPVGKVYAFDIQKEALDNTAKLLDEKVRAQEDEIASNRRSQVGTGDRSERIRTYNYPEGRISDHRIGLTIYRLEQVLNGNLDEVIDALATADQAAKLASQENE